jgi:hypothetical protein
MVTCNGARRDIGGLDHDVVTENRATVALRAAGRGKSESSLHVCARLPFVRSGKTRQRFPSPAL